MSRASISILILALLLAVLPASSIISSGSVIPVGHNVTVKYPQNVYVNQTFTVYVNNSYGLTNYTTVAYFSGDNMTGFSPTNTFEDFGGTNPMTSFSVTAPSTPQTIYMYIETFARYGSQYVNYSKLYSINVYDVISLSASVSNANPFTIDNVSVSFELNGNLYGVQVVNLTANSSQVVSLKVFSYQLPAGAITLTVTVNNPMIKVNGEAQQASVTFYNGTPPNYDWIYYVAAGVLVFMVLMVLGAGRRPNRPSRPKWRR